MNDSKMVNFRLPADLKEQLKAAAQEDSRTVSGLITAIIKSWLKENEKSAA